MVGTLIGVVLLAAYLGFCVGVLRKEVKVLNLELGLLVRTVKSLASNLEESEKIEVEEFGRVWAKCYSTDTQVANMVSANEDHEARIAYLEKSLTAKPSEAKIVPKAHKRTFRQFAEAASRATEAQETAE